MVRSWVRRLAQRVAGRPLRAAAPAPPTPAAARPPCLEWLEDRCLLATGLSSLPALAGHNFTAPVAHFGVLSTTTYRQVGQFQFQFQVAVSVTGADRQALTVNGKTGSLVLYDSTAIQAYVAGGPLSAPPVGPALPAAAPLPPPPKPLTPSGSGAAAPAPPRPVDPTTFFVWTSQRDQGATVPQPTSQPAIPAPELRIAFEGAAEPARLDVRTYFVAEQGGDSPAPPQRPKEVEGRASRPPPTAAALGEWMRAEDVAAALADAIGAAPLAAVTPGLNPSHPTLSAPADPEPVADGEERARASREGSADEGRLIPRATAWLLVTQLVYGLWGNGSQADRSHRLAPASGDAGSVIPPRPSPATR